MSISHTQAAVTENWIPLSPCIWNTYQNILPLRISAQLYLMLLNPPKNVRYGLNTAV